MEFEQELRSESCGQAGELIQSQRTYHGNMKEKGWRNLKSKKKDKFTFESNVKTLTRH